jgi:hypothetical protein
MKLRASAASSARAAEANNAQAARIGSRRTARRTAHLGINKTAPAAAIGAAGARIGGVRAGKFGGQNDRIKAVTVTFAGPTAGPIGAFSLPDGAVRLRRTRGRVAAAILTAPIGTLIFAAFPGPGSLEQAPARF